MLFKEHVSWKNIPRYIVIAILLSDGDQVSYYTINSSQQNVKQIEVIQEVVLREVAI